MRDPVKQTYVIDWQAVGEVQGWYRVRLATLEAIVLDYWREQALDKDGAPKNAHDLTARELVDFCREKAGEDPPK